MVRKSVLFVDCESYWWGRGVLFEVSGEVQVDVVVMFWGRFVVMFVRFVNDDRFDVFLVEQVVDVIEQIYIYFVVVLFIVSCQVNYCSGGCFGGVFVIGYDIVYIVNIVFGVLILFWLIVKGGVVYIVCDFWNVIVIVVGVVVDVSVIGCVQSGSGCFQMLVFVKLLIQFQFYFLMVGFVGVFIIGVFVVVVVDYNFIIGIGLEQGGGEQFVVDLCFVVDFYCVVGGGFQVEVEVVLVIGVVGEFVNGWCFEVVVGGKIDVLCVGQGIFQ